MCSALFAPHGTSMSRSILEVEQIMDRCLHDFSCHSRNSFSTTLSKLKSRGLVLRKGSKKKAVWFITSRGKAHFKDIKSGSILPSEDGKVRLVVYDIPEDRASKRVWLRKRLLACDYRYLQRSVWLGTRPLPKELQDELKERKLLPYIHVVGLEGFLREAAQG